MPSGGAVHTNRSPTLQSRAVTRSFRTGSAADTGDNDGAERRERR